MREFDAAGDGSADLETRLEGTINEFTLPNGMHFIVKQRRNAPVVACHTYANVGAFDDEAGHTGVLLRGSASGRNPPNGSIGINECCSSFWCGPWRGGSKQRAEPLQRA